MPVAVPCEAGSFHRKIKCLLAALLGLAAGSFSTASDASPRIKYGNINGINAGTDACKPDDVYVALKQARPFTAPVDLAVRGVTSRVPWRVEDNEAVGTFGYTRAEHGNARRFHAGTDLLGNEGEAVSAVAPAEVLAAGSVPASIGNYVVIRTSYIVPPALPCAIDILYAHLQRASVKAGDKLKEGDEIGKMGRTGNLDNAIPTHLHIELWVAPYQAGLVARRRLTRDVMNVFKPSVLGMTK